MIKSKKGFTLLLLIILVVTLTGCADTVPAPSPPVQTSGAETTTTDTTQPTVQTQPPSITPPPSLEPGTIAIYFTQTLDSVSGNLKGLAKGKAYSLDWSKTGYGVFRYLPESEELTLAKTTISPSYAKHTIKPLTLEGSLYLATEYSTQTSLDKINPQEGETLSTTSIPPGSDATYAILGDRVYYRNSRDCFGTSCRGGALMIYDLNSRQSNTLLPYGHEDNFGSFYAAGGNVYTAYNIKYTAPYDQEGWLIHRRDLDTFAILETIADYTVYTNYEVKDFAFDGRAVYVEAYNSAGGFELWKQDLSGGEREIIYTNIGDGTALSGLDRVLKIDADDGIILINFYKGPTILFDENTNIESKYNLGLVMRREVEILKIR